MNNEAGSFNYQPKRRIRNTIRNIHNNTYVQKRRVPIPIHKYLEDCTEKNKIYKNIETQYDEFAPRKPSTPYIPPKLGFDFGTQTNENEIFDLEGNILSIVNVIVDKTIEQSHMEVIQEETKKILAKRKNLLQNAKEEREKIMKELIQKEKERLQEKNSRKEANKQKQRKRRFFFKKLKKNSELGFILDSISTNCFNHKKNIHLSEEKIKQTMKEISQEQERQQTIHKKEVKEISLALIEEIILQSVNNLNQKSSSCNPFEQ